MKAPMVEALMPLARASSANCLFQASKPAAVLPHWAALAVVAMHPSAAKAATATILNCLPLITRLLLRLDRVAVSLLGKELTRRLRTATSSFLSEHLWALALISGSVAGRKGRLSCGGRPTFIGTRATTPRS